MFKIDEIVKATKGNLENIAKVDSVTGVSIDSRTIKLKEAFFCIKGDNFDGHDFIAQALKKGASCIVKERRNPSGLKQKKVSGIPFIEVEDTLKALGDLAGFNRRKFDIPVIAVTGSNGKTTAKEMIACALSGSYNVLKSPGTQNNHIGLPMTLLKLGEAHDCAVLEIGANHKGEVAYLAGISRPNIGVITNIGSAHLEYFKSLEGVFREKSSLLNSLENPCLAVLNADDQLLAKELRQKGNRAVVFGFGIKNKSDFSAAQVKFSPEAIEFLVSSLKRRRHKFFLRTLGCHNVYNALAAIAVGRILGVGYKKLITRLSDFDFPQGRLKLKVVGHIRFLDDTYNANPSSLKAALEALSLLKTKGRKIFVMGDMLELGKEQELFHREIGRFAAGICDCLISVGRFSEVVAKIARQNGLNSSNIFSCACASEARDILLNQLSVRPEDIVLVKGSRLMKMEEVLKIDVL